MIKTLNIIKTCCDSSRLIKVMSDVKDKSLVVRAAGTEHKPIPAPTVSKKVYG